MENEPLKKMNLQSYNFSVREFYLREDDPEHWMLDAPYQRARLWSEGQNQNLIKSLLQGIPIGVIFVNHRSWSHASLYVVDGKQRISAVRDFVEGRLEVPSAWFKREDVLIEGDMVGYPGLSLPARRFFDNSTVAVSESKFPDQAGEADLYLLVNFGGVPQTEIDLQRARDLAHWASETELID